MWTLLHEEILQISKFQAGSKSVKHAISGLYSEKIVAVQVRYNRIQRLLKFLMEAKYLPLHSAAGLVSESAFMKI